MRQCWDWLICYCLIFGRLLADTLLANALYWLNAFTNLFFVRDRYKKHTKNLEIKMKTIPTVLLSTLLLLGLSSIASSEEDKRILVKMPKMMQQHQLANMRDHLMAINEILLHLGKDELDKAAEIAEARLGMSSLSKHGAHHMAKVMPKEMRAIGTSMHKAASRFALKAQEGDALPAYKALQEITSACVACHAGYRTR